MANNSRRAASSGQSLGVAVPMLTAPSEAHFVKLIGLGLVASTVDFALTWISMPPPLHALSVVPTFLLPIQLRRMQRHTETSPKLRNATRDSARRARLRGLLWKISHRLS